MNVYINKLKRTENHFFFHLTKIFFLFIKKKKRSQKRKINYKNILKYIESYINVYIYIHIWPP
jgi:hypothetical protein